LKKWIATFLCRIFPLKPDRHLAQYVSTWFCSAASRAWQYSGGDRIYGVIAISVAQRTRGVGIRMALGAQRADVVHMILRQSI
jgi:hypothetical protein